MKLLSTTALVATAAASLALSADAAAKYKTCTESERQSVFGGLTNELKTCTTTSTFDLTGKSLPTSEQRQAVCKCTDVIKRLGDLSLPRCNLVLDGSALSFKEAFGSIFTECGIGELKEVPETLAPGANSTSTVVDDDKVAGEASSSKANATSKGSKSSSSGSGFEIETPKPTKAAAKTPVPTTKAPASSGSGDSNSTSSTPSPTKSSSPARAMTSAAVAVLAAVATYAMF